MLKQKPKKGLFDLFSRIEYDIYCDSCGSIAHGHHVLTSNANSACLSSTGDNFPLCTPCFNKGLVNLKLDSLHSSHKNCSLCQTALNLSIPTIDDSVKFICHGCLKTKAHPCNAHRFSGSNKWERCDSCGTVKIQKNGYEHYWIVGSTVPHNRPLRICHPGYSGMYDLEKKCGDNHLFITIEDFTKNRNEVKRITKKDLKVANEVFALPGYEEMYPITGVDLAYSSCGYKLQWCSNCGHIDRELPDWWTDVV